MGQASGRGVFDRPDPSSGHAVILVYAMQFRAHPVPDLQHADLKRKFMTQKAV